MSRNGSSHSQFVGCDYIESSPYGIFPLSGLSRYVPTIRIVVKYMRVRVPSHVDTGDIEGEAMLAMVRAVAIYFHKHTALPSESYIFTCARERIYKFLIKDSSHFKMRDDMDVGEMYDLEDSSFDSIEDVYNSKFFLDKLVRKLDKVTLALMKLHFVDGISYREMERKTGIPYSTVRRMIIGGMDFAWNLAVGEVKSRRNGNSLIVDSSN